MKLNEYITSIDGEMVIVKAYDKTDAFMRTRLMGYKGEKNDIRLYN